MATSGARPRKATATKAAPGKAASPNGRAAASAKRRAGTVTTATETSTGTAGGGRPQLDDLPTERRLLPVPVDRLDGGGRELGPGPVHDPRRSDVDEWGRSERFRQFVRAVYDPIYTRWHRVEWEGLEHIPADGGALLVANHAGAIPQDAPAIMHGIEVELGRPVYGLAEYIFRTLPLSAPPGPDPAVSPPTPTTPTGSCASSTSSPSSSPRARRPPRRPTASATACAASAGAASSRSPCAPACRSCRSRSWAPRRRCRSCSTSVPLAKPLGVPYVPITANMLLLGPLGCSRSRRRSRSRCSSRCTSTSRPTSPATAAAG